MANTKDNTNNCQQSSTNDMVRQLQSQQRHPVTATRAEASLSPSSSALLPPSPALSCLSSSSSTALFSTLTRTNRKYIKMSKLYTFIGDTYRDIRKYIPGICHDMNNTSLIEIINKYRKGIYEVYSDALEYLDVSRLLAKNIAETLALLKDMSTTCVNLEEYYHRVCELVAIFISCELRVKVDSKEDDLTSNLIVYTIRKYLIQDDDEEATLYNILRTLVYIPRFFNVRNIMCEVFEALIPLKLCTEVKPLSDKLYILYIIVFYRWMKMQKEDKDQQLIINFAMTFMKPTVSLCTNPLYCQHLPRYTRHSEATRTILMDMKFYKDLKNACIIDNAYKASGTIVNLCEDDDVIVVDDSAEILSFAELFTAVQLEIARPLVNSVKREEKTIVDSVDLTVDEDDDVRDAASRAIWERHEHWLDKLAVLTKESQESLKRLQQQQEKSSKVICLDSDSDEDEMASRNTKGQETNGQLKKSTGPSANQMTEAEDLFADSYPITLTPIDCNADLETSDNEVDNDDGTKLPPRFLPTTLRTYAVKKSSSCSVSSAEDNGYRSSNQHDVETSDIISKNNRLPTRKVNYRRNTLHVFPRPPFQQAGDESSEDDVNTMFHANTMGPGVPFANINSTFSGEKVIFSQAMPSMEFFQSSDSDAAQAVSKKPEPKSKRVHFDSSPMGPTSAYSKQKLSNKSHMPQQQLTSGVVDDICRPHGGGDFDRFRCAPSLTGSTTSTAASGSNASSLVKQNEHIAAAATLFRNVFDRSRNNRLLSFSGNYPSMLSTNLSLSPKHKLLSPRFDEEQLKKSLLKRNRLKQRRSTICGRSDFNDYRAQFSTMKPTPHHQDQYQCANFDWEGFSLREKVSDHLDIASNSNTREHSDYQDVKLAKRCAVVIEPTEELLQYERERDAMYNEILQKQRRKLELRAIEKMKEKERRRQEKEQKREQFQLEQTETVKQLERMNLSSKSDEDETNLQICDPTEPSMMQNETRVPSPAKKRRNSESVSDVESQEFPPPKRSSPEKHQPPIPQATDQNVQSEQQEQLKSPTESQSIRAESLSALDTASSSPSKGKPGRKNATRKRRISVDVLSSKCQQVPVDDMESSESDQIPLLQRRARSKKSVETHSVPHSPQTRKPNPTPTPPSTRPIRECRQSDSQKQPKVRKRRHSMHMLSFSKQQEQVDQTTDSELETRQPARISRERRKSTTTKSSTKIMHSEQTTDSEMELEQRPGSALRQSPRFAGGQMINKVVQTSSRRKTREQSDSEIESQVTGTTNMSPPKSFKGRPKLTAPKDGKQKQSEADATKSNEIINQKLEENTLPCIENDSKLTEENIVAVIAQRLSSPDSTLMHKEIETSEHEEILETLEDLLQKEARLRNQLNEISGECASEYVTLSGTSSVNRETPCDSMQTNKHDMVSAEQLTSSKPSATDTEVIEKIIINEIQREMEAEISQMSNAAPVDYENVSQTESEFAVYTQTNDDIVMTSDESHTLQTKPVDINFEDEVLQEMLGKSMAIGHVHDFKDLAASQDTLPLLITNVESLSSFPEDDNHPQQRQTDNATTTTKEAEDREQEVLVTENILLAEGRHHESHQKSQTESGGSQTALEQCSTVAAPVPNVMKTVLEDEISNISLPKLISIAPSYIPDISMLGNIVYTTVSPPSLKPTAPDENHSTALVNRKTATDSSNEGNYALLNSINCSPEPLKGNNNQVTEIQSRGLDLKSEENSSSSPTTNSSKNKADLKMYKIKACCVKIVNLDMSQYMNNRTKNKEIAQLPTKEMMEEETSITKSPTESVASTVTTGESRTSSTPECILPGNEYSYIEKDLVKRVDEINPKLVESDLSSNAVSTPETSCTSSPSEKQKSKIKKTVTFNLVAEIIPISPFKYYTSPSSIEDREQTPPNDYHWNDEDEEADDERIHRYYSPLSMITPATRKYFNDDLMTTSNTSSSCSSTDTNDENNSRHDTLDDIAEEVVVETSNHTYPYPHSNELMSSNGALTHINSDDFMTIETTETVPIYLFSNEIVDIPPTDSTLVSSTYVASAEDHRIKSIGSKSLMSPSEQEVSSTQETFFQSPDTGLTNENKSSMGAEVRTTTPTRSYTSTDEKTSSGVLQNNQVDTTNHSPEICPTSTLNANANSTASSKQSTKVKLDDYEDGTAHVKEKSGSKEKKLPHETTTKTKNRKLDHSSNTGKTSSTSSSDRKKIEEDTKRNLVNDAVARREIGGSATVDDCGRNSPSTTTLNEDNVSDKPKEKKFRIPKLTQSVERSESPQKENLKYTASIAGARNPFVVRPKKSVRENTNCAADVIEQKQKAETPKKDLALANKDGKTHSKNVVQQKEQAKAASKPELSKNGQKLSMATKPKPENAVKQKQTAEDKVKSEGSLAKEVVSSTKPSSGNAVHQTKKNKSTVKSERSELLSTKPLRKDEVHQKQKSTATTAKSEHSTAKKNLSATKPISDNTVSQKPKTTSAKLENSTKPISDNTVSQKPKTTSTKPENSTKPKPENTVQQLEQQVGETNTQQSSLVLPQPKTTATKRESPSVSNIEHKAKKVKRHMDFTELQQTIDVEIFTMATDLTEQSNKAAKAGKDELPSRDIKSKGKLKDPEAKGKDEIVAVNLIKISDLRQLTTTGIKSAVSHDSRKYSPKMKSNLNRNTPSATVKNTNKPATPTSKNSSIVNISTTKTNSNSATAMAATTPVNRQSDDKNLAKSTVATNRNKPNDAKSTANSSTNSIGAEVNAKSVQSIPPAAKISSISTSSATTDAANHVRKKQRTK